MKIISKLREGAAALSEQFHRLFPGARSAAYQVLQVLKLSLLATSFWILSKLWVVLWGNIDEGGKVGVTAVLVLGIVLMSFSALAVFTWAMKSHVDAAVKKAEENFRFQSTILAEMETAALMKQAFVDAAKFAAEEPPRKPAHFDDWAVDQFALEMKKVLAKKREEGAGGWQWAPIKGHMDDLAKYQFDRLEPNYLHIANYAMMLWVRENFAHACANPHEHVEERSVHQAILDSLARKE